VFQISLCPPRDTALSRNETHWGTGGVGRGEGRRSRGHARRIGGQSDSLMASRCTFGYQSSGLETSSVFSSCSMPPSSPPPPRRRRQRCRRPPPFPPAHPRSALPRSPLSPSPIRPACRPRPAPPKPIVRPAAPSPAFLSLPPARPRRARVHPHTRQCSIFSPGYPATRTRDAIIIQLYEKRGRKKMHRKCD